MSTERQAEANRRNARRSTGPRSAAGRRRASRNSYRHGLTASFWSAERSKLVESLARRITGGARDARILHHARSLTAAQLDIAQIRRVKAALINQILVSGKVETSEVPPDEPERSAEAVRLALPELVKLDRYERRAAARRSQSIKLMIEIKSNTS